MEPRQPLAAKVSFLPQFEPDAEGGHTRTRFRVELMDATFAPSSYYNTSGTNVANQVQDAYNGYGQLITQYQAVAGAVNTSSTPKVQYGYSAGANYSRPSSLTYPNGRVVNYNYTPTNGINDAISRLSSMSDSSGNIESYSYLGLSTIVRKIRPGSVLTYVMPSGGSVGDAGDMYTGLDRFGRVINQLWATSDTPGSGGDTLGTITDQFQYGYDRNSNVLYKNNIVHSADSELYHANGVGESTAYDSLNRLTGFRRGTLSASGSNGTTLDTVTTASSTNSWSLDALGNSTSTGGTSRTFNSKNQFATYGGSSTITYDHDGNMTTDQAGNTYSYDAWNRLVFVNLPSQSTNEAYTYNANNQRPGLSVCNGAVTTSYYSTNWQELEDDITSGSTTTKNSYVWSISYIDDLVARDSSVNGGTATRIYAQQDANHDITSLTNSSGTVLERFAYDPYGARTVLTASWSVTSDSYNWVYGFQGGRLDPLTGLVNFRNRDLNPTTGTWMEQDPAGYIDSANLYQFVDGSPAAGADPMGLDGSVVPANPGQGFFGIPSHPMVPVTPEQMRPPATQPASDQIQQAEQRLQQERQELARLQALLNSAKNGWVDLGAGVRIHCVNGTIQGVSVVPPSPNGVTKGLNGLTFFLPPGSGISVTWNDSNVGVQFGPDTDPSKGLGISGTALDWVPGGQLSLSQLGFDNNGNLTSYVGLLQGLPFGLGSGTAATQLQNRMAAMKAQIAGLIANLHAAANILNKLLGSKCCDLPNGIPHD
jgi:RHS repeat-associated protein